MEIITRKEAKLKGLKNYFNGVPCEKAGHLCERNTRSAHCLECAKIRNKAYYEAHTEELKAYAKNYDTENPRMKILKKERYYKNREKISEKNKEENKADPALVMWKSAKIRSKQKGLNFDITPDDIRQIIPKDGICPVLGVKMKTNEKQSKDDSISLDRIFPHLGYVKGNIAIMCYLANGLKRNQTDPQIFYKLAKWLEDRQNEKH